MSKSPVLGVTWGSKEATRTRTGRPEPCANQVTTLGWGTLCLVEPRHVSLVTGPPSLPPKLFLYLFNFSPMNFSPTLFTFSVAPNTAPGLDLTGAKDEEKINTQISRKAGFGYTGLSDGETAALRMLGVFSLCSWAGRLGCCMQLDQGERFGWSK